MERRSMWSRLLAIVLAVSMVFSSQSMSVFADTLAIIQQPQDTNEKKNQPADDTSKDNQETSEESEEETTAAEEPQQSEPAEESSEAQQEQTVQMTGTINGENVNLRSEPSTSSEVLSKAQTGDVVSILGEVTGDDGNTWYEILYGQGSAFVSAEFVTVEETAEEESEEEKPAKAAKNEPKVMSDENDASDNQEDNETANDIQTEIKNLADSYFSNPNAPTYQRQLTVSMNRTDGKGSSIKTGDLLTYNIAYTTKASPLFKYPSGEVLTLFDTYDNTKIYLTLPAGMEIVDPDSITGADAEPDTNSGEWIFTLKNSSIDASKDGGGSFTINVRMTGNGTIAAGTPYSFAENSLRMETSFTVKNKMSSGSSQDVATYNPYKTSVKPSDTITAATGDQWTIRKSKDGEAVFSEDGETVTVKFLLQVGLTGLTVDGKEYTISDSEPYGVYGRVPFDGKVSLGEALNVTDKDGTNQNLTPKSVTVKEQFDSQTEYKFGEGGNDLSQLASFEIQTDTCAGHGLSGKVADSAPYYSAYSVEVVYDAEAFTRNYDEDQSPLTITNTATFDYKLAGVEKPEAPSATASVDAVKVISPATLNIKKYIDDYQATTGTDSSVLYSKDNAAKYSSQVTGASTFTIKRKDNAAFKIYKNNNGSYTPLDEQPQTSYNVTIDPNGSGNANSTTGIMTVYLDAGTYIVEETAQPANTALSKIDDTAITGTTKSKEITLAAGNAGTVKFTNKENFGDLKVTKYGYKDGEHKLLNGVEFTLYKDADCTEAVGTSKTTGSGNSGAGTVEFTELPAGTYWLKETKTAEDYILDPTPYEVMVAANQETTFVYKDDQEGEDNDAPSNKYSKAYIRLQKQYFNYASGSYQDVDRTNYGDFQGAFKLEQKVGTDGTWETVEDVTVSIGEDGTYTVAVPVYQLDANGNKGDEIKYRFTETFSEGTEWKAPEQDDLVSGETLNADGTYSVELPSLVGKEGTGNSDANITEAVMRNQRDGDITLTKNLVTIDDKTAAKSSGTAGDGQFTFKLYKKVGENGNITEVANGSYVTDASGKIHIENLPGAENGTLVTYYLVEENAEGYALEPGSTPTTKITVSDKEVTAIGPITFNTGDFEREYTVTNVEQQRILKIKKVDAYSKTYVKGAHVKIEVSTNNGQSWNSVFEDVTIPSDGYVMAVKPGEQYQITEIDPVPSGYYKNTTPLVVTIPSDTVTSSSAVIERTLENTPHPKAKVTKNLIGASGTATNGSATFEIYQRTGEDVFTPVLGSNGNAMQFTSGQEIQLEAGTYYLHEVSNTNNQALDPDIFHELYTTKLGAGKATYSEADEQLYFGPFKVTDKDTTTVWDVENYLNEAKVEIYKEKADVAGGNKEAMSGATIQISEVTDGSAEAQVTSQTSKSGADGKVTFTLPVYKTTVDGKPINEKISYNITETESPTGYYMYSEDLQTTLEIGTTTMTVNNETNGAPLTIQNRPYTTFTVTKEYYKKWEYSFTQKKYPLEGAQIALYRLDGNQYVLAKDETGKNMIGTTNSVGQVIFYNLKDEETYVAVEIALPSGAEYQYLEPETDEGSAVDKVIPGKAPGTIAVGDIEKYNYVAKPAGATAKGTLTNVEHWTQIRVNKIDQYNVPVDHCIFELYKQVVTGDETELTFNKEDPNFTLVGTYTTGTLLDKDGNPIKGQFATDILNVADNVVYWLVETEAAPGYDIIEKENHILFKRTGTSYTNGTNPGKVVDYAEDSTTQATTVVNHKNEGPGSWHIARIKLSKWAEDGDTYKPLGNTKYEIWIADKNGSLLQQVDTVTTGLESDGSESNSAQAMSTFFWYEKWQKLYPELIGKEGKDSVCFAEGNDIVVRMAIREVSAPAGYNVDAQPYYLYLHFENALAGTSSDTVNDVYYVNNATEEAISSDTLNNYPAEDITWADKGSKYRLVNRPVDNFAVTISKYGYTPNESTMNQTSAGLDKYFQEHYADRVPLSGVEMTLQRKDVDGQWKDYDYENLQFMYESEKDGLANRTSSFTTQASGSFSFPYGLKMGEYLVYETSVGGNDGYEMLYDSKENARYFTVAGDNLNVSMYNPAKITLDIQKQTLENKAASNVIFTLTEVNGTHTYKATTGNAGNASFVTEGVTTKAFIESGNYYLTEENNVEYLTKYLGSYISTKYPKLADLTNASKGIHLGNATKREGSEIVVTARNTWASYNAGETLLIQDPEYGSITVTKTDMDSKVLGGATFKVWYKAAVSEDGIQAAVQLGANEKPSSGGGWADKGSKSTDPNTGKAVWTGLEPGIYYIEETGAPTGYEKTQEEGIYVLVTGGMQITVTSDGETPVADDTFKEKGTDVKYPFKNRMLGSISVTKNVEDTLNVADADAEYTFTLYDAFGNPVADGTKEIKDGATATFENLALGTDYYLAETNTSELYSLTDVRLTGANSGLTAETSGPNAGRYKISLADESGASAAVTATNTYLSATVTIFKADSKNTTKGLTGAEFKIYRDGDKEDQGKALTPVAGTEGAYSVTVTLPSKEGASYTIKETKAPNGYIKTDAEIKVTLKPGDNESYLKADGRDESLVMYNDYGAVITLTKYDNVKNAANPGFLAGTGFTLYRKDGNDTWQIQGTEQTTDTSGKVTFTVAGEAEYAIAETKIPQGYSQSGLESLWKDGVKVTQKETLDDGTTLYVLGRLAAGDYSYQAYNTPEIELEVRKTTTDNSNKVQATVSIYEIDGDVTSQITDETVGTYTTGTPYATVTTSQAGAAYTYAGKAQESKLGEVKPGYTYLAVETESLDENYPIVKDDKRVIWYDAVYFAVGDSGKKTVTLRNIKQERSLALKKTASKETLPDLYELGDQEKTEISYTLTPTVTNNHALYSFTLTDDGLTAYGDGSKELDFNTYLKDKYSITSVVLQGPASHSVDNYTDPTEINAAIQATVTFYGFNDKTVGQPQTITLTNTPQTVTAPSGSKIKSMGIVYEAPGFKNETSGKYCLGENFKPGTVTVNMELYQQDGGKDAAGASKALIKEIKNEATAVMTYYPWEQDGNQSTTKVKVTVPSEVNVTVSEETAPVITVDKETATTVALGHEQTYTITVTNNGDKALSDPVIVDLLPQGVNVDTESTDYIQIQEGSGLTQSVVTTPQFGENTAIVLGLKGELAPKATATITVEVTVGKGVVGYGNDMRNYVFVTSAQPGTENEGNKEASAFKNENGDWAKDLKTVAAQIKDDEDLPARVEALEKVLIQQGIIESAGKDHGFVADYADSSWLGDSNLTLHKEVRKESTTEGESTGYQSERTVNISKVDTVYYRLSVSNTSDSEYRSGLKIMDVLPQVGDLLSGGTDRYSAWNLELNGSSWLNYVKVAGKDVNYKVYYYTGEIIPASEKNPGTYAAILEATYDHCPAGAGWTSTLGKNETATAFIIVVDDKETLRRNEQLSIEYTTKAKTYNDEELANITYESALNDFVAHYSSYPASGNVDDAVVATEWMQSNAVRVAIQPEKVQVGGHIWIDADSDGQQNDGSFSEYYQYKIVQDMIRDINIYLDVFNQQTAGKNLNPISTREYADRTGWGTNPEYTFTGLDSARLWDTEANSYTLVNGEAILNPAKLIGDSPATYLLRADLSAVNGKFEVTPYAGAGYSREPSEIAALGEDKDNNYRIDTDTLKSERFYLYPSTTKEYDKTKDLGLVLYRGLEITKIAADRNEDGTEVPVKGATFTVYGPFEDGEGTKAVQNGTLTSQAVVGTFTTEDDGKVRVTDANGKDLLWFKEYVIVETSPSSGYTLEGASLIDGEDITGVKGSENTWVLGVPDIGSDVENVQMKVSNVRKTTVDLEATKKLSDMALSEAAPFSFELLDSTGQQIATATANNAGEIVFEDVTLEGVGEHIFYIKEIIPTDEEGEEGQPQLQPGVDQPQLQPGVDYDTTEYKVTVVTTWKRTESQGPDGESVVTYSLEAGDPDYEVSQEGNTDVTGPNDPNAAVFTNVYTATGKLELTATKTVNGETPKADEVFNFSLTSTGNTPAINQSKANKGNVVTFDAINYTLDDAGKTYTYEVKEEDLENKGGYTKDGTVYTVTVNITDKKDGTLDVQKTITKPDSDGNPKHVESISFDNTYTATGTLDLTATKTVNGKAPAKGEIFEFTLTSGEDTLQTKKNVTYTEDGNETTEVTGTVVFDPIEYTLDDVGHIYTYEVKEKDFSKKSYTKDETVYTVTVEIKDETRDGKLEITKSIEKKDVNDGTENVETISFDNTYTATGSLELTATKTVNGETPKADEVFNFSLTPTGNTPGVKQSKENVGNAVTFDEITYTLDDVGKTYTYEVKEENLNKAGYTKDETIYTVTVGIKDEIRDGKLEITKSIKKQDGTEVTGITFDNTYEATGYITQSGTKRVEGGPTKQFTFGVYTDESCTTLAPTSEAENVSVWVSHNQVKNTASSTDAEQNFNFNVYFNEQVMTNDSDQDGKGEAVLYIKEVDTELKGYDPDRSIYRVTYEVTDERDSTLTPKVEKVEKKSGNGWSTVESQKVEFINKYTASGSTDLSINKILTGKSFEGENFAFKLTQVIDGKEVEKETIYITSGTEDSEQENTYRATAKFTALSYSMADLATPGSDGEPTTYESERTFIYRVREDAPADDENYTYSKATYEIHVTVVDDGDGSLEVSKKIYPQEDTTKEIESMDFKNEYHTEGTLFLSAYKVLQGQKLTKGSFTFTLTDITDSKNEVELSRVSNSGSGDILFDSITYDEDDVDKTFKYRIEEVDEGKAGYGYDDTAYIIVVIPRDVNGTIEPEVTCYKNAENDANKVTPNDIVFRNTYEANGSQSITGKKIVENRKAQVSAGEFGFKLEEELLDGSRVEVTDQIKTSEGGAFTYTFNYAIDETTTADDLTELFRTHTYYLTEIPGEEDSVTEMTYSKQEYKIEITVSDKKDGTLEVSEPIITETGNENNHEITFTNIYRADGNAELNINKTLTGNRSEGIGAGEFSFTATRVDEDYNVIEPKETYSGETVKAAEDTPDQTTATITIPYDESDIGNTYYYKITEDPVEDSTIEESKAVYYAMISVSDSDTSDHTLKVDVVYQDANENVLENEQFDFENAYKATGKGKISGTKTLTGNRGGDNAFAAGEFSFQVINTTTNDVVGTAENKADHTFTVEFGKQVEDGAIVPFTQADISETPYTNYELVEFDKQDTSTSGITYSPVKYPLEVKVSDGSEKGTLNITVRAENGASVTFENQYKATETVVFTADKVLTGNRAGEITDGEFDFTAERLDNKAVTNGTYNAKTGRVEFEPITYTQEDIGKNYIYRLSETEGSNGTIDYDLTSYYAKVSVSDAGGGKLDVDVKYYTDQECADENELTNGITFTNHYKANGEATLTAKKTLEGRTMSAGEFIFGIYEITRDEDGNVIGRTLVTDENGNPLYARNGEEDENGTALIQFASIQYDQDDQGIHEYEIVEFNNKAESITYDDQPVKVSVTVRDKHGNGDLTVDDPIYESGEGAHTEFTNTYQADGSVTFTGLKRMLGNRAMEIQEGEFTFTVTENGNEVATGKTLDGGIIEFTTIKYDENDVNDPDDPEDVHTYVISEDMGEDESVSYTAPDVTVTVKVTDNTDGTLTAVPTYPEGGMVFENQYFAEGEITLTGTKELLGNRGTELADGEFQFEIRELDENGDPGEEPVAYGENKADGTIAFDPITYKVEEGRSDIGTHVYVINEVTGGNAAVDYTEDVFEVTVEVTDFGRGTLEAAVVPEESDEVLFQNHYRASGEVLLDNFTKALNGSPLAAGQFTFQLADADGNVLQTVTNAADGSIPFEALTYDESDIGQEYTYTVSEVNNNVTGVAYDTTIYTVIVAVADSENSDGTLDITTTILNGEETIEGEEGELPFITFTNTFGGTVTLTKQNDSQQVLAGAEFQLYARMEGADTYEVYASEGNAEGRYTTDVNGQIQITDLPANDYYFVETRAPQGYVIETDEAGQPLHYDFTIGVQDGVAGIAENAVVNAALTVTNDGATTGSIQVTKRVGRIGDNFDIVDLIAVNETYYVGLFLDAAGTQPYGTDNVKAIQMNGVSVSEAVTFDNLPSGTYYVLETDAQGNPIVMNETQTTADGESYYCTLEEGQNNQVTVDLTVSEEPGAVMLTNVYLEFSEDYYWDATIDITKRVLRNGEEATADDTFYAGVYQMLEDGSYELLTEVELQQNDTVTVTGLGGPIGESMTYYVFETDGNGNRVSEDPAFRYAVSGEGSVTVTQDSTAGSITITNEYEEEEPTEEPSEKPTEKPSERPTEPTTKSTDAKDTEPTTTTSTKATKTGDTTDLTVELLLMAVAAVLMGTSVYARKRRRNRR